MTYQQIINQVRLQLAASDIENPAVEAENLIAEVLGISGNDLAIGKITQKTIDDAQCELINSAVQKRAEHYPLQYITSRAYFRDLVLEVNPDVLIPRFETEILVDEVLKNIPQNGTLLDVGTGSGAIALSCAVERTDISVTAVDISEKALATAKRNAEKYGVKNLEFRQSDLVSAIQPHEKFDVIAANLPYVTHEEYETLQPEVKVHEPRLALTANDNGLELIIKLCRKTNTLLNPNGFVILEMSPHQTCEIKQLLEELDFSSRIINDLTGRARFVCAVKK